MYAQFFIFFSLIPNVNSYEGLYHPFAVENNCGGFFFWMKNEGGSLASLLTILKKINALSCQIMGVVTVVWRSI